MCFMITISFNVATLTLYSVIVKGQLNIFLFSLVFADDDAGVLAAEAESV